MISYDNILFYGAGKMLSWLSKYVDFLESEKWFHNIFLDHQEKCYTGDQNVFIFSSQKNDFIAFSLVIQEKCYDGDQNVFIFSSQKNDFVTETLAGTGSSRNMFYMEQVLRGTSWNSLVHLEHY